MIDPTKMTNEELIDHYWDGKSAHACDHIRVAHEIQSRLRNSIPTPTVTVTPDADTWDVTVNGEMVAWFRRRSIAYDVKDLLKQALGITQPTEKPE